MSESCRVTRRTVVGGLVAGGAGLGLGMTSRSAGAFLFERHERRLALHNLWTEERIDAVYWRDGEYLEDTLSAFNQVLRDRRTGEVQRVYPRLYDLLVILRDTFRVTEPIGVISAFRSPETNEQLREMTKGVARNSLHRLGLAMDVRVEGVPTDQLFTAAAALAWGGTGLYRESNFVHIDLGPPRLWGV
ncbi:MAG: DUF882 domain-containing protein [Alphaproteobacteria bacterium]|nr:DUF882 domain-containing protein [Alphaproteobacteria bacterium]